MTQSERHEGWAQLPPLFVGILGAIFLPSGWFASGRPLPFSIFLLVPVGGAIGYAVARVVTWIVVSGAGSAAQSFTLPATTGHFANEHSEIDTLEVRGAFKEAVSAWEAVAMAEPGNPWPLVRSAELCARELGEPALALERFRLARALPHAKPELKRYTSQKIIDLLLGPLNDKGRAMVELRMLVDTYPSSREAEGARDALKSLKSGAAEFAD